MAISYVNTTEVENITKEMTSLTNELETTFNDLFQRLTNVPRGTGEWIGGQADFYFDKVATDKQQYVNFINDLRKFTQMIDADMTDIRTCMKKNNNDELKKGG